jgi:hypothetical protein
MSFWSKALGVMLLCAVTSWAANSAKPPDISLPDLGDIPKADGLKPKPSTSQEPQLKKASLATHYTVIKVDYARSFAQRENGTVSLNPLTTIPVTGDPAETEKFSSRIRVQCPDGIGAPIELTFVDSRGDTALSSNGYVHFRPGAKETDYLVDWDPTRVRGEGKYTLQIRLAGQSMGSWPVTFAQDK